MHEHALTLGRARARGAPHPPTRSLPPLPSFLLPPQEAVLVVPYDRRLPFVRVRTRMADRLLGQRFVVRVDGWDRTSR